MADGSVEIKIVGDDSDIKSKLGGLGDFVKGLGVFELVKKGMSMVTSSIDSAVSRYDTLNNFPKIMQQMGYSAEDSSVAVNKLSDGIQGLPTALDDIVSTAKQITATTGDLNLATDTALALNNAFIASGAGTEDAKRGLQQYTQMLSSGKVDMQSWRTLNETMTYVLQKTAESFGFAGSSAKNDLYKALQEGDITFTDFNARLIELSNQTGGFAEIAKTAAGGIATALTNMKTRITKGVTEIISAIDSGLANTPFESIEGIITKFGDKFRDVLIGIAERIPSVIAAISSVVDTLKPFAPVILAAVSAVLSFKAANAALESGTKLLSGALKAIPAILGALSNPIVLVVAAIGALAAAFAYLWNTNEEFRNKVIAAWDAIKAAVFPVIESLKSGFSTIKESLSGLGDSFRGLWDKLQPVLSAIGDALEKFLAVALKVFGNVLIERAQNAISVLSTLISGLAGVISGAIDTVSGFITIVQGIFEGNTDLIDEGASQAFSGIVTEVQSVVDTAIALLGDLPSRIGAAIAGAIEAIATWGQNVWTTFTTWVSNAIESVSAFFATLPERIGFAIGVAIGTIATWCVNVYNTFVEWVPKAIDAAIRFFSELPNKVWNAIVGAVSYIQQWGTQMLSNAQTAASNIISNVASTLQNLPSAVWNAIVGAISSIITWGQQMVSNAKNAMINVKNTVVNTLKSIPGAVVSIGQNIVQGLWNGIKASAGWLMGQIKGFASSVIEGFKSAFAIHSPSRIMRDVVGKMLGLGIAVGIEDSTDDVVDAANSLAGDTTETLTDGFAKAGAESVLAMAQGMVDKKKTAQEQAEQLSKDIVSKANDWLSTQEHFDRISAQQTVDFWEEVLQITDLGADEVLDVEKKLYTAKANLSKATYDHSKNWIDKETFYERLSATEKVEAWERVASRGNLLAKEQEEAERNLFSARKALAEEESKLFKERQSQIEEYSKMVESRASALSSSLGGIFDEFKEKDLGDTRLLANLEGQVEAFETWQDKMDALLDKGYSDAVFDEFYNKGPAAMAELNQLLGLTEDEMERYNAALAKRNELINEQAQADVLRQVGADSVLNLVAGMNDEQKELNQHVVGMAQMAAEIAEGQKPEFAAAGTQLAQGIAEGINAGQGDVFQSVQKLAEGMLARLRSSLEIHSPSRKARKIMQYFGEGMAQGLRDGEQDVLNQVGSLGERMLGRLGEIPDEMALKFDTEMRHTVDVTKGRVSADVGISAAKRVAAESGQNIVKERYTTNNRQEVLGTFTVDDRNLTGLARELARVLKVEQTRVGSNMIQRGAPA